MASVPDPDAAGVPFALDPTAGWTTSAIDGGLAASAAAAAAASDRRLSMSLEMAVCCAFFESRSDVSFLMSSSKRFCGLRQYSGQLGVRVP